MEFAERVADAQDFLEDRSPYAQEALLLESGNAVHLELLQPGQEGEYDVVGDLNFLGPIEHTVLQYGQLLSLDSRTLQDDAARHAEATQEDLTLGLEEYERPLLVFGTAQDVADHLHQRLHMDRLYNQLKVRVDTLAQLSAALDGRRNERRGFALGFLSLLATALFALPAIRESLELLRAAAPTGRYTWLTAGSLDDKALQLYVMAVVAVTLLTSVTMLKRVRAPKLRRRRRIGILWSQQPVSVRMTSPWDNGP